MNVPDWVRFVVDRLPELARLTVEHLSLTGIALLFALVIGLPAGILATRYPIARGPILAVAGILQTIPSLAMLTLLLAITNQIGVVPAVIALTLYALLPIVRNTIAGLDGVSPAVLEAARGIGMTDLQQLIHVRLPLALPVIVAGIRTAAVIGIGIATLSAFIGAGGLGVFINRGLSLSNTDLILLGAVPAALLALLVDFSIGTANGALEPRCRVNAITTGQKLKRRLALVFPILIFCVGALRFVPAVQPDVRVGSKNFTEQIILGHMMAQVIEDRGLRVERQFNLGGTGICHEALVNGKIDLYAEYTGTALLNVLKENAIADADRVYEKVARAYRKDFDLVWLKPFGFNNVYAITVRAADARRNGWSRVSDLATVAPRLTAGITAEFSERPDGYPGFQKHYFPFGKVVLLEPSLMYDAIRKGEVDVISAFTTDGRIDAYDLVPLTDDRGYFPPYFAAPVVRSQTLRNYPEVRDALNSLGGVLNNDIMKKLNYAVDHHKRAPADVAREFLENAGLLRRANR